MSHETNQTQDKRKRLLENTIRYATQSSVMEYFVIKAGLFEALAVVPTQAYKDRCSGPRIPATSIVSRGSSSCVKRFGGGCLNGPQNGPSLEKSFRQRVKLGNGGGERISAQLHHPRVIRRLILWEQNDTQLKVFRDCI